MVDCTAKQALIFERTCPRPCDESVPVCTCISNDRLNLCKLGRRQQTLLQHDNRRSLASERHDDRTNRTNEIVKVEMLGSLAFSQSSSAPHDYEGQSSEFRVQSSELYASLLYELSQLCLLFSRDRREKIPANHTLASVMLRPARIEEQLGASRAATTQIVLEPAGHVSPESHHTKVKYTGVKIHSEVQISYQSRRTPVINPI